MYTGEQLRRAWLQRARREWAKCIRSVGDEPTITRFFDENGWARWLRAQPGCERGYVRRPGSGVDYCGHFLAWCGRYVGEALEPDHSVDVRLRPELGSVLLASTLRITEKERWQATGLDLPQLRSLPVREVQPGDVITVVTTAGKSYGDHYAIVLEVDGDRIHTIEGNATGTLGDGSRGHGVVRRTRVVNDVRRVWRFDETHFLQRGA